MHVVIVKTQAIFSIQNVSFNENSSCATCSKILSVLNLQSVDEKFCCFDSFHSCFHIMWLAKSIDEFGIFFINYRYHITVSSKRLV